jgi:hypothetical protein
LRVTFNSLLNAKKEKKKKKELPFIIPPDVVRDIIKDPFTGEGSQGPSDHLYKLEARCSLFKLSGIFHDDVKKNYVPLEDEAKKWYHSLNHSDGLDWEYLENAYFPFIVIVLISIIFGLIPGKLLLELGGDRRDLFSRIQTMDSLKLLY